MSRSTLSPFDDALAQADKVISDVMMSVYVINGKKYPVVGEMCMNMTAVKVDSSVKIDDEVTLLGDGITVGMFGRSSGMGNAEALVNIGKNNPRFYVKDGKVVKEK